MEIKRESEEDRRGRSVRCVWCVSDEDLMPMELHKCVNIRLSTYQLTVQLMECHADQQSSNLSCHTSLYAELTWFHNQTCP